MNLDAAGLTLFAASKARDPETASSDAAGVSSAGQAVERRNRWILALILAAYVILALAYGAVNPLFEAPDEQMHYFTVQAIAETGRLPEVAEDPDPWMGQEAAQPPLYYLVGAALVRLVPVDQAKQLLWFNPRVQLGDASSPTNTNAFVHTTAEAWPWRDFALRAHLLRVLSTLLGLGTLICIYGSARLIWPMAPERALLATALTAFLPQFLFLHSAISNDTLIVLLSAAALWQLLRLWYQGLSGRRLVALGLTIGLAVLSKIAGLLLLAYAVGFVSLMVWRDREPDKAGETARAWLVTLVLLVTPAVILGGWLLWRNWALYGDPTATSQFIRLAGGDRSYTLAQVLGESSGLWASTFAVFGWMNVRAPQWIFYVWDGLVLAAAAGAILGAVRRWRQGGQRSSPVWRQLLDSPWMPAALLALWVLLIYAGLVSFMLRTPAAQGRLLFPALLPLALGLAYGLSRFRWRGVYLLAPLLALLTSVTCLLFVIPPTYALPDTVDEGMLPPVAARLNVDLGQGIELVASQVETQVAEPGDWVHLTLYWRANEALEGASERLSPEYVLELLGRNDALVGKLQSYHGGGLYPATLWPAGQIIADQVAIRLDDDTEAPVQVRLNLKLVGQPASSNASTSPPLVGPNEARQQTSTSAAYGRSVDVGTVKVVPPKWPSLSESALARFEGIKLTEAALDADQARPGQAVPVTLRWQIVEPPGRDLTTFVHLGDPTQPPLAQGDSPPLGGNYPTRLWAEGEVIDDVYSIALPQDLSPGRYPVNVGLYDPNTGIRVPAVADGQRQANDAVLVGWLTVRE